MLVISFSRYCTITLAITYKDNKASEILKPVVLYFYRVEVRDNLKDVFYAIS